MKTAIFLITLLLSISGFAVEMHSEFVDITENNGNIGNGLTITLKSDAANAVIANFSKGKRGAIGMTHSDGSYEETNYYTGKHIKCQGRSDYSDVELESICTIVLTEGGTARRVKKRK